MHVHAIFKLKTNCHANFCVLLVPLTEALHAVYLKYSYNYN